MAKSLSALKKGKKTEIEKLDCWEVEMKDKTEGVDKGRGKSCHKCFWLIEINLSFSINNMKSYKMSMCKETRVCVQPSIKYIKLNTSATNEDIFQKYFSEGVFFFLFLGIFFHHPSSEESFFLFRIFSRKIFLSFQGVFTPPPSKSTFFFFL